MVLVPRVLTVPRVLMVLVPRVLTVPRVLMVLVLAAGLLVGCDGLRVKEGVFDTVDEARAAGAVAAGWVPDTLPRSARDLREGHLPDGRYWGVFTFPAADEAGVRALLGDEITSGTLECDAPGRLEWWPSLIRTPVEVTQVRATGFRVYHSAGGRIFVVNWGQGRAYYWHSPA
jgi:hypothetical protein